MERHKIIKNITILIENSTWKYINLPMKSKSAKQSTILQNALLSIKTTVPDINMTCGWMLHWPSVGNP
jgi:hypothetical protein